MLAAYLVWSKHLDSTSAISMVIVFIIMHTIITIFITITKQDVSIHWEPKLSQSQSTINNILGTFVSIHIIKMSQVRRERRYSVETKVQEESVSAFQESMKQNNWTESNLTCLKKAEINWIRHKSKEISYGSTMCHMTFIMQRCDKERQNDKAKVLL